MKTSAEDKADCLNSVFAEQCSAPPSTGKPRVSSTSVDILESFSFTAIAQESVKKSLSKLNVWKAVGPDGIPNRVLKECAATLAEPLTFIFNCSLTSGLFPIQWKQGVIKPLFKNKGARNDPSCYRPVVLLPCVSKVFEGFVREQLQEHCMRIGVIPDEQYGFLGVIPDEQYCFLDVAKAFDRVDHTLLEHTLSTVGVQAKELSWFVSYLNQRSICTSIDGCKSSFKPISSGVPQGSVLGPLLFILYFGDIPSVVFSTCALFADDTLLYDRCYGVCTDQPCCRLEEDIRSLDTWADGWCTTFNASKSAHMFISSKHRRTGDTSRSSLSLSGGIIPLVRTTAHLGVRISSTLSWSDHMSNIIRRVKFKAFLLKRLARRHGSADLVKRLYRAVLSVLCSSMLRLFGMHAPNMTPLPWSASSCR